MLPNFLRIFQEKTKLGLSSKTHLRVLEPVTENVVQLPYPLPSPLQHVSSSRPNRQDNANNLSKSPHLVKNHMTKHLQTLQIAAFESEML
jgi:hypothetical protein